MTPLPDTDAERFHEVVRAHAAVVTAFAARRWPNDAEDLVARAFEIGWQRWGDRPDELDAGLLIGIVRNLARNLTRSHARQRVLTGRLAGIANRVPDPAETDVGPSRALDALAALADDDQLVLTLVAWDDADTATIARALGVSRTAARVRLHRARRRFEAAYIARPDEEGRS